MCGETLGAFTRTDQKSVGFRCVVTIFKQPQHTGLMRPMLRVSRTPLYPTYNSHSESGATSGIGIPSYMLWMRGTILLPHVLHQVVA